MKACFMYKQENWRKAYTIIIRLGEESIKEYDTNSSKYIKKKKCERDSVESAEGQETQQNIKLAHWKQRSFQLRTLPL